MSATITHAYPRFPLASSETRIVPAIAVPRTPRFAETALTRAPIP